MLNFCKIFKKKPLFGNNRSHAMNKTKRKFMLNIHNHKFWFFKKKKYIKFKIINKAIRIINKKNIKYLLNLKK